MEEKKRNKRMKKKGRDVEGENKRGVNEAEEKQKERKS